MPCGGNGPVIVCCNMLLYLVYLMCGKYFVEKRKEMQVHGKVILGFPFGDSEIEQHFCDFYVIEGSHDFVIEVDDYPIEKACDLVFKNDTIKVITAYTIIATTGCIKLFSSEVDISAAIEPIVMVIK